MVTMKTALQLIKASETDLIWIAPVEESGRWRSTPYTLKELREQFDWKRTIVHEINLHTVFCCTGFELIISKKGD